MDFDLNTINNEMPEFENHDHARHWFKEQFPDRFFLKSTDINEGKRVYYYHLIKDTDAYLNYMESFGRPGEHEITHSETFESYSTVEINEDGEISFLL